MKHYKGLVIITLSGAILAFSGCATKEIIVTKEVKIPVKCEIQFPNKQIVADFSGNRYDSSNQPTLEYLNYIKAKLLANKTYILELEHNLDFCINGITENTE